MSVTGNELLTGSGCNGWENSVKFTCFSDNIAEAINNNVAGGIEYLTVAENSSADSGYLLGRLLSFPESLPDADCIALTTL